LKQTPSLTRYVHQEEAPGGGARDEDRSIGGIMGYGNRHSYYRVGWAILVAAVLAIGLPILATAAQPHVLWLFSTSYGAIGLVVGITFIRVGTRGRRGSDAFRRCRLEPCRS
jgi:hypothetical protein